VTDGDTGAEATAPAVRGDVTPAVGVACAERGDRIASPGTAGRTVGSIRVMGASATVNDNNGYSASTLYLFRVHGLGDQQHVVEQEQLPVFLLGYCQSTTFAYKGTVRFQEILVS